VDAEWLRIGLKDSTLVGIDGHNTAVGPTLQHMDSNPAQNQPMVERGQQQ
jgi:hypothetical protein